MSGQRQECGCERLEVTSTGGARDHVPSYLGNVDTKSMNSYVLVLKLLKTS